MEANFSIPRILLFLSLIAVFALLGGFSPLTVPEHSILDPRRVGKAWFYCVLMYHAGAVSTSLVDHFVGTLDRANIRLAYVVIGIALMAASVIWLQSIRWTLQ